MSLVTAIQTPLGVATYKFHWNKGTYYRTPMAGGHTQVWNGWAWVTPWALKSAA
jgi:hypothetical protein